MSGEDQREQRLQRYLAREMPPDENAAFEAELLASDELAETLMDELALRELVAVRRGRQGRRPRRWLLPAACAAAAVVVAALWPGSEPPAPPVMRSAESGKIVALEPLGAAGAAPKRFRWRGVAGAAAYRVEVFDNQSRLHWSAVTPDTFLDASDVAELPPTGYWRLTPVDSAGVPGTEGGPFRFGPP